jgi:Protein of unknown function (DUF1353)
MQISRRSVNHFLRVTLAICAVEAIRGGSRSEYALAASSSKKPKSMAEWMDTWTRDNARDPQGSLFVYRFKDPMWALLKPIGWRPNDPNSKILPVAVPSGFVTDFASIPRAFYSLLRPDGEYTYPAIIHDYLYWTQLRSRVESDEIIRLAMIDFKIDSLTVQIIYRAVRSFGGAAWDENKRLKAAGEKRFLAKFPEDPRVTWTEWKQDASVFAP